MSALAGRTALVTGAASGIDAAIAEAYAAAGVRLCLADRAAGDGDGLQAVADRCATHRVPVTTVRADVALEDDVARMSAVAEELGALDVLVNNAGILTECTVADMPTALPGMLAVASAASLTSPPRSARRAAPGWPTTPQRRPASSG